MACQTNLRELAMAKDKWAKDERQPKSAVPGDGDLFGTEKYIREKPSCPADGDYIIGAAGEKPRCSIPDHTI
jgi:hypothetical protein